MVSIMSKKSCNIVVAIISIITMLCGLVVILVSNNYIYPQFLVTVGIIDMIIGIAVPIVFTYNKGEEEKK